MPKTNSKPKKSTKTSRKSKKQHPKHFLKVYWPYIPIIAVVAFSVIFGNIAPSNRVNNPATLAYSTEMSKTALLNFTNDQRILESLGALTLNSRLNSAAQAKANHMVANDYWAHNTPDGEEPWIFFDGAGYSYQKAGENLAYGFLTSSETIIGWMNSPSHRANILDGEYTEVGFGFANSENFISTGQETIVVAHYAKPSSYVPPEPTTPVPAATQVPATEAEPEVVSQQAAETKEQTAEEETEEIIAETGGSSEAVNSDSPVADDIASTNITRVQSLTKGVAPWSALALSMATFAIIIVWLVKHAILVKRFAMRGEHFVAHHPLIDLIIVIVAAMAVYLSKSIGVVL